MAANWYFARQKQKLGPFSWNQLRQLAAIGVLQRDEHVLEEGTPRWREAGTVEGLFPRQTTARSYRLSVGGKAYGPYPADQVRVFLLAGQLPATTLAHTSGMAQWLPVTEIADFTGYSMQSAESRAVLAAEPARGMTPEEAELHLAGKGGDPLARLASRLMDLKRRFAHNTTLQASIEQNIRHLVALREQRGPWVGADPGRR